MIGQGNVKDLRRGVLKQILILAIICDDYLEFCFEELIVGQNVGEVDSELPSNLVN